MTGPDKKEELLLKIIGVFSSERPLTMKQDGNLIRLFDKHFGSKNYPSGLIKAETSRPDIRLLNRPEIRKSIVKTLSAVREASRYPTQTTTLCHTRSDGEKVSFKVNNPEIAGFLQRKLDSATFQKLFDLAADKGVFDLQFEFGVPCVTLCAGSRHMTRKWPRDHAGMMPLIEKRYSNQLWPGLKNVARSYLSPLELRAFETVIASPKTFKQNKGIAHVFWLNAKSGTLVRDKDWEIKQRIESHAEYLNVLADAYRKILPSRPARSDREDSVFIKNIVYFTHYLYALGINPQTCGPWEEIPFAKGSNWDSASVVCAFDKVLQLLAEVKNHPFYYKNFIKTEKKLSQKINIPLLFAAPKLLDKFNRKSLSFIRKHYLDEFRGHTARVDSSSVMLSASGLDLSSNGSLTQDIGRHLQILKHFQKHLVKEFGALRYNSFDITLNKEHIRSCDSYLNLNSDILLDNADGGLYLDKKKRIKFLEENNADTSSLQIFKERNRGFCEATSAQWGLPLSYAAVAYGKLVQKLLRRHRKQGCLSSPEQQLLKECLNGEEEFIKRSYGNITGLRTDGSIPLKANGTPSLPWKKPEAYQAVSSLEGKPEFLPGVNSHLGWDAAKCWEASEIYLENLRYIEEKGLL